ncbi:transcriptional family [Leptolyngbya sp. Heron Island J]|uniref:helix-turn-helix domain-containing protein n=1 Tax=Leptolyngbya sp. Heron Island J TaxID=1385935 RepID=UPI0003B9ACFE|nr:AraC family transcriptional regulator [Leptolyngbya sp. Heron Island J]ESA33907.1 transcriptional family [Leptolyngbya sp. Heron Island J]
MAKILTGAEVNGIISECRADGSLTEYTEGAESFIQTPPALGQGWGRHIELRPGLTLSVIDITKHQTHVYKIRQHSPSMPLTFNYYLSGGCQINNDGLSSEEEIAGKSYLYRVPNTAELETYPAGKRICWFQIRVALELIHGFCDRIHELPTALRNTLEHPENTILYHPSRITPAQRQILQQILEWPYQGIARQLYLEGKVLELLALHFNQVIIGSPQRSAPIKARDVDRIYEARDILTQNAINPPSLAELARRVHLNELKLTQGFKQVFDTTVFGYLYNYRMEQACQLLHTGSLNIQEVARSVGYTSRSSFVAAFKKKFKVAPSIYLKKSG